MSLRYSRPVKALIATGLAASTIGLAALPAAAGSLRGSEWWMTTLGIRDAWPVTRGAGVTVAVLNDGMDTKHPDLTGTRFSTGPDYTGTGQGSGQFFGTVGTGVAGIIAAHGFGLQSVDGVVGEVPLAHVLSVRVTLPPGDPLLAQPSVAARLPGAIAQGIRYAVGHGASVIDLPLDPGQAGVSGSGGAAPGSGASGASAAAGGSPAEAAAVKYALGKNVVLVAPAGDDNLASDAANFPAAYPGVIAVGAFDKQFVKAPWTSHQSYVTVTAAGSGMTVATNTGSFETASGTTYASAVVTGIVAMLQARFPGITVAQVRQALTKGTVFHGAGGHTNGSGYGTVNAEKALTVAEHELASPSSLAGTRATTAASPSAPVATSSHQGLLQSITRAGIIAAGLLVILLALIALYAIGGRRRAARRRSATAADWSRQGIARHPRAGATDADRMAEYFAAPIAAEPTAATAGRPASRGLKPSAAERAFSGAHRPAPLGGERLAPGAQAAGHPPWDAPDAGSGSPIGPASRAVSRRPPVTGAPPWEEALPPEGDLPWASPADRSVAAGRHAPGPADVTAASAAPAPPPLPTRSVARHQAEGDLWERAAQLRAAEVPEPSGAHADFRRMAFRQASGQRPEPFAADAYPAATAEFTEPAASGDFGQRAASGDFGQPGATGDFGQPGATGDFGQPGAGSDFGQPGAGSDFGQPAGAASRPGPSLTGRLDWGRAADSESAPRDSGPSQIQAPGGPLPVRQPRHSAPSAALSPSGSLWERNVDRTDAPADEPDPASRPIFVWSPPGDSSESSADLTPDSGGWRLFGRREDPPAS